MHSDRCCGHQEAYANSVALRMSVGTDWLKLELDGSCVTIRTRRDARAELASHQHERTDDEDDGDNPAGDLEHARPVRGERPEGGGADVDQAKRNEKFPGEPRQLVDAQPRECCPNPDETKKYCQQLDREPHVGGDELEKGKGRLPAA